jgi:O-antigen ligase
MLGIATVLLSASRGPFIALLVLFPMVVYFASKWSKSKMLIWALVASIGLAIILPIMVKTIMAGGVMLETYFGSVAAFTAGESSENRMDLMSKGWEMFLNHPLFGGGLFEPSLITYPHNTVVEAFMATGIFGGMAYLIMLVIAAVKAFVLMKRRPEMSWLPVLFLQQVIFWLTSGCIYFSPTAFALLGVMLAVRLPVVRRSRARTMGSERKSRVCNDLLPNLGPTIERKWGITSNLN